MRLAVEGELLPHDRVRLVNMWRKADGEPAVSTLADYKRLPMATVLAALEDLWPRYCGRLNAQQRDALRPMSWGEARKANPLLDFGGHTHQHVILSNETREGRTWEIRESLRKIAGETGREVTTFSYPNGLPGDYDEGDKQVLRDAGCRIAVTVRDTCLNPPGTDLLELHRVSVSLGHNMLAFRAELSGLKARLISGSAGSWQ